MKLFFTKVAGLQYIGYGFIESNVLDIDLTFNSEGNLCCVKDHCYIQMPIPMPIPRFSNTCFPGFCQFRMEKKEFAV